MTFGFRANTVPHVESVRSSTHRSVRRGNFSASVFPRVFRSLDYPISRFFPFLSKLLVRLLLTKLTILIAREVPSFLHYLPYTSLLLTPEPYVLKSFALCFHCAAFGTFGVASRGLGRIDAHIAAAAAAAVGVLARALPSATDCGALHPHPLSMLSRGEASSPPPLLPLAGSTRASAPRVDGKTVATERERCSRLLVCR